MFLSIRWWLFVGGIVTYLLVLQKIYLNLTWKGNNQTKKSPMVVAGSANTASRDAMMSVPTGLRFWSSDFHIAPVADVKQLLAQYGVTVIDKSLSGHCHLTKTCQTDLQVITRDNGITLGACPNRLRRQFYEHYSNDAEFMSADAILCTFAFASCVELAMPFNKSIVMIATTRFETGRHDYKSWQRWVATLRIVAANPYHVVAANNQYDVEYIRYFTGIDNVQLLPSYCGYVQAKYSPTRPQILLGPGRGLPTALVSELQLAADGTPHKISMIRDLYPHFEYQDLASHPAMILFPYQLSIMTIFELYRMQIPLFVPSPELLVDWQFEYNILKERTWTGVYDAPTDQSILPRHPNSTCTIEGADPNNDKDRNAILAWIKLADFYFWPSVNTFSSWKDLLRQLDSVDLGVVSAAMGEFNAQQEQLTRAKWEGILHKVKEGQVKRNSREWAPLPTSLNEALYGTYGITLSQQNCFKVRGLT